jgi:cation:H+ antiporter
LLAFAVFGAMYHSGFGAVIDRTEILSHQMILATGVTLLAVGLLFQKEIGLRTGFILLAMYVVSIGLQFFMNS